jgi:transposase-like protein
MTVGSGAVCPACSSDVVRKDGRDRQGRQVYRWCVACRWRFTDMSATPFSGYRFPPDIIVLAVR